MTLFGCKDENETFSNTTCFKGRIISNGACTSGGALLEILSPDIPIGQEYLDYPNVVTTFNLPQAFRNVDEIVYFQIEEIQAPSTRVCLMLYGPYNWP